LLNEDADRAAQNIGLPGFSEEERGTTILVLQPHFVQNGSETSATSSPLYSMRLISEYLLWYFWPKMLAYGSSGPSMVFNVSWNGEQISVPHPTEHPRLKGFAEAMYRLKGSNLNVASPFRHTTVDIESQRPAKHLGRLALQQFPVTQSDVGGEVASPFEHVTHHTALMRTPELVVKYLGATPSPNARFGYAGVFITDSEVDEVFADAEPPTHDDWVSDSLTDPWHKRYVNVGLRRITEEMDAFAKPPAITSDPTSSVTPLAAFATGLGSSLLPAEYGTAASLQVVKDRFPTGNPEPSRQRSEDNAQDTEIHSPAGSSNGIRASNREENDATPLPPHTYGSDSRIPTIPITEVHSPPTFKPPQQAESRTNKPVGRPRLTVRSSEEFLLLDGDMPALRVDFVVTHGSGSVGTIVYAAPHAVLDGNQLELEPPSNVSTPEVLRWISPTGEQYAGSDEIYIESSRLGVWSVLVTALPDIVLGIELSAEAKAG
jgi:hypothetical protein